MPNALNCSRFVVGSMGGFEGTTGGFSGTTKGFSGKRCGLSGKPGGFRGCEGFKGCDGVEFGVEVNMMGIQLLLFGTDGPKQDALGA